ncbi:MAG: hypothetical protein GEU90_19860 [Gemmatimonas sp.]|nr:hypothetical protein [Gemmatimonas sp.]
MNIVFATLAFLLQASEAGEAAQADGLSGFSWTFMIVSMAAVTLLAVWCYARIFRGKRHFDPDGTGPEHSPVEGKVDQEGGV